MGKSRLSCRLALLLCLQSTAVCGETIDFNRDVRPLLSNNCFQCHGPDTDHREAELRLDVDGASRSAALTDGLESEFFMRIASTDEDTVMPPPSSGKELSAKEIERIKQWIEQGAEWEAHWAYEPPRLSEVPDAGERWAFNWIDRFVVERLSEVGLTPSKEADPVTLVRRLYFDLIGLPPTPAEVEAFLQGGPQLAYEATVDRLLESPHFGERMAVYWLDLVRYADTVGYHGDQDQNISPYRDYVIDAFNRGLPFDQFTREQLAGDLLDNPTVDQQIATGYNRMLQTSHEGGVQPKEYLTIYQADRVRNVSAVWLGGTLGCAQCHDHKYDPYTSADFYSMAAFFADIDEEQHFKTGTNSLPTARPPEMDVLSRREREELERLRAQIVELDRDCGSPETERQLVALRKEEKRLMRSARRTMVTVALDTPRIVRLLPRGDWLDDSGPVMQPAVPAFLGRLSTTGRATRLDLASWLVDSKDGAGLLTARVMVNRLWYLMFGRGLSESLSDFGGQGKPPTHPELLDNLAIQFVESGWDIKQLLKTLAMSRTYRLSSLGSPSSSTKDPANAYFSKQSRYRLPAEIVRDVALSAGGLLIDEFGGPSVKPYQPLGYYRHLNFPKRRYAHHADSRQWRRGVYVHWQRQFLHPMLKAFDAPRREECTAQRPISNTPLAALVLLNDPTFVEAARGLAGRLLDHGGNDSQRVTHAYQIVLSRAPTPREREALLRLLSTSRREYQRHEQDADAILSVGEKQHEGRNAVELAAWTTVARAMLNLGEAMTRQ